MLGGFAEKLILADTLRVAVDNAYSSWPQQPGCVLALATVLYAFSLYYDFAGYSHIAIGGAAVLGLPLARNFARPYLATNFSGFWSRWHISLSSWLQDYIFTPLVWLDLAPLTGGWRQRLPVWICILAVFLVSGMWHGDTLVFLVWGLVQAAYRIGEEALHRRFGKPRRHPQPWVRAGKRLAVFALWCLSLVFFRAPSLGAALSILGRIVTRFAPAALSGSTLLSLGLAKTEWTAVLAALAAAMGWELFAEKEENAGRDPAAALRALPGAVRFTGLAGLAVLVLLFACRMVGGNASVFYYAQF